MIFAGLDGYGKGWVRATIADDAREIAFVSDIAWALRLPFDRMAVDMPIGLPDSGERACDRIARERLRPNGARVFAGARRGLWDFASAAAANRVLHARGEKGISLQLWHLGAKICELDAAMTPSLQSRVREAHPELVFLRLNGGAPLPSKNREEGAALRRRLLHREGFTEIARWLKHDRIGTGAKADDVLDACAMAVAARNFDKGFALPPNPAPRDRRGMKMQIWY